MDWYTKNQKVRVAIINRIFINYVFNKQILNFMIIMKSNSKTRNMILKQQKQKGG